MGRLWCNRSIIRCDRMRKGATPFKCPWDRSIKVSMRGCRPRELGAVPSDPVSSKEENEGVIIPYKNIEDKRKYMRDHYHATKHKRGITSRVILSKTEIRRRKTNRNSKYRKQKRLCLLKCFGEMCPFCGYSNRITIHRKDCKPHKNFYELTWEEINDVTSNDKNEYVSVCHKCHKHIHWCVEKLGMTWNEIYEKLSAEWRN
jgi:hypothetical protein